MEVRQVDRLKELGVWLEKSDIKILLPEELPDNNDTIIVLEMAKNVESMPVMNFTSL
jgi:alpha-L-fucosidase